MEFGERSGSRLVTEEIESGIEELGVKQAWMLIKTTSIKHFWF